MGIRKLLQTLPVKKRISADEQKVSYVQLFGFILTLSGVITIIISGLKESTPSVIAVSFLIIILGLAFVFGAKPTQAFSERKFIAEDNLKSINTPSVGSDNPPPATLSLSDTEIIKMAVKQYSIKHLEGVTGVGRGFRIKEGKREECLQINVNDEIYIKKYSEPLNIDLGNGASKLIQPNIVFAGKTKTHSGEAGSGIYNMKGTNGFGTFGCVVIDNDTKKKHILSCQHVLNHDFNYDSVSEPSAIALYDAPEIKFALHVSGERSHEIDAGLAEILNTEINYDNKKLGKLKGTRDLNLDDLEETIKVSITGFDKDSVLIIKQNGVIINNEFYAEFEYPNGKNFGIEDLIVLSEKVNTTYTTLSKHGYSGALVIDENFYAIGLLVGGDAHYSYAIPINKILTAFNCSLLISS